MSVKVYSTPPCTYCQIVKELLKENKIEFENIDVTADQAAAEEMVDQKIIVGFNHEELKTALNLN